MILNYLERTDKNKEMKTFVNDYCIRMFADSGNSLRPQLNHVSLLDGCLYATNAHIVARINADLCVQEYLPIENYPNARVIFDKHKSVEVKKISVDKLFSELMKIECCFKPKLIDCDNCEGDGTAVCEHCGSKYKCTECKGSGKIESTEIELTGENDCNLFGKKYKLNYLDLIIRTAVFIGAKEIQVSNPEEFEGTLFTVGDFSIILMPCTR